MYDTTDDSTLRGKFTSDTVNVSWEIYAFVSDKQKSSFFLLSDRMSGAFFFTSDNNNLVGQCP